MTSLLVTSPACYIIEHDFFFSIIIKRTRYFNDVAA